MVQRQDMHNTIWEFKDVSDSVKVRHEQWERYKETLKSLLVTIKDRAILEILDEDYSVDITEENDSIILEISNDYLEAQLIYQPLYNGKINIYIFFPELQDNFGNIVTQDITTKEPNEINESKVVDNLNFFFKIFKTEISGIG